jgi:hypothetical protein
MADNDPCYDDPRKPFCDECPDHEACAQGMPKRLVKGGEEV